MADSDKMDTRNPSEVQVDILLEAQRGLSRRITGLEEALDVVQEVVRCSDRDLRGLVKDVYMELDMLSAAVFQQQVPRRCSHCLSPVGDDLSSCPSCLRVL